jgi:hypothetical protein
MSLPAAKSLFAGYRFPTEVISQAVWYNKIIYRWRRRIEIFPGLRRGRLWQTQGE